MEEIRIEGGAPLNGQVAIQGSKNAALPMMAAALLSKGVSVLEKCPRISDVYYMEEILKDFGVVSWWEGRNLYLDCRYVQGVNGMGDNAGKMRSSIILLGVMAARFQKGCIGYPGGCVIGKRPIDLHLYVLQSLGIRIEEEEKTIRIEGYPKGNGTILFSKKSVGATEQALLAAVLAEGKVLLRNCAKEPEIQHLAGCLNKMGGKIRGAGTEEIFIEGVKRLQPFRMQVPPDRIVAGTYLFAGAATRGKVTLLNPPIQEMQAILTLYHKIGGQYEWKSGKLITDSQKITKSEIEVETQNYPGFPTDLQSPLMAVLSGLPGCSSIRETIFEARYGIAEELKRMGADIRVEENKAVIAGRKKLFGKKVTARELRGGAALVIAGLEAEGETRVEGYSFIKRGYEDICGDIGCLGGKLRRNLEE